MSPLSKCLIVIYSPLFLWWWERTWGEWRRCCDVALGSYWPSMTGQENYLLPVILDHQPWWSGWSDVRSRQCWWLGSQAGQSWMERTFIMWLRTDVWLTTYSLFTSGIFHLVFLDLSWLQVTETLGSKTANKWGEDWIDAYLWYTSFELGLIKYDIYVKVNEIGGVFLGLHVTLKLLAVNVLVSCLQLKATKVAFFFFWLLLPAVISEKNATFWKKGKTTFHYGFFNQQQSTLCLLKPLTKKMILNFPFPKCPNNRFLIT